MLETLHLRGGKIETIAGHGGTEERQNGYLSFY